MNSVLYSPAALVKRFSGADRGAWYATWGRQSRRQHNATPPQREAESAEDEAALAAMALVADVLNDPARARVLRSS